MLQAVFLSCPLRKHFKQPVFLYLCCCFSPLFLTCLHTTALCQRERRACVAVWLAAVNGACLSWPTYRWRPRICGRFRVNPSSWLRNWATASLEKSGWVGTVLDCVAGAGRGTTGVHLNTKSSFRASVNSSLRSIDLTVSPAYMSSIEVYWGVPFLPCFYTCMFHHLTFFFTPPTHISTHHLIPFLHPSSPHSFPFSLQTRRLPPLPTNR